MAVLSLALAAWAAAFALRDRAVVLRQLKGAAVVEAALVLQVLAAVVATVRGEAPDDAVTFWGYLLTALVVLPVAAAWAFAERTRWSSVVLLVAALTVVVMEWRLLQIWAGA
ncbi:hypothetical protein CAE01nite_14610 [Cellulomonas aerilata]|uniref:Uncharacterized protein n=1 Tax=Cellulomonas aerilata TaxID=515326 RepID=A0A512DB74_9CELL|nr:hypothetical protein CAE01nite_14610 [Cellulomonas aerilata]